MVFACRVDCRVAGPRTGTANLEKQCSQEDLAQAGDGMLKGDAVLTARGGILANPPRRSGIAACVADCGKSF
jgi:hypothetical protein